MCICEIEDIENKLKMSTERELIAINCLEDIKKKCLNLLSEFSQEIYGIAHGGLIDAGYYDKEFKLYSINGDKK